MILDMLPTISRLYFDGRIPSIKLSFLQIAVLVAVGLQHRDVDSISIELDLPSNQVLAFFNKTVRKIASTLRAILEEDVSSTLPSGATIGKMEEKASLMSSLSETFLILLLLFIYSCLC
jgi:N-acetyltransferase 10